MVGWPPPLGDMRVAPGSNPACGAIPDLGAPSADRTRRGGPIVPLGGAMAGIIDVRGGATSAHVS